MTDGGLASTTAAGVALGLSGGVALALAHLNALALNVRLYLAHGPVWRPVALHCLRAGLVMGGFTAAAMLGAHVLLASLAGYTVGRVVVLGRHR